MSTSSWHIDFHCFVNIKQVTPDSWNCEEDQSILEVQNGSPIENEAGANTIYAKS